MIDDPHKIFDYWSTPICGIFEKEIITKKNIVLYLGGINWDRIKVYRKDMYHLI